MDGAHTIPGGCCVRSCGKDRHETADLAIDAHQQVELAVLSVKSQTARCRFLGSGRSVTLRGRRPWVPSEIVRMKLRTVWASGNQHLSAEIKSDRIDAPGLGLTTDLPVFAVSCYDPKNGPP